MDLVVRDDKGVKDFLDAAFQAQLDNKQRARKIKRAKRSRARDGHYIRGNHAPYGFRYVPCAWDEAGVVTDQRLEPDTFPYAERDWLAASLFAEHPYAARMRILDLYVRGVSPKHIAAQLTEQGVPTASQLHGHGQTSGVWWPHVVLHQIVLDPLNQGVLRNFRHTYELMEPDDQHDDEWLKVRPTKPDEQITVTPTWLPEFTPLLDETLALAVATRRASAGGKGRRTATASGAADTLLAGRAVCALCGGGVRISRIGIRIGHGNKPYAYYRCNQHEQAPSACPGWSLPVWKLDTEAWTTLLTALDKEEYSTSGRVGGRLAAVAEKQARTDTDDEREVGVTVGDLRAVRAQFHQRAKELAADAARTASQLTRNLLYDEIAQLEKNIALTDGRIGAAERRATNDAARTTLLGDVTMQLDRYWQTLTRLDPLKPEHRPACRNVLALLGAQFRVQKDERGWPSATLDLTITAAAAQPWFTPDTEPPTLANVTTGESTVVSTSGCSPDRRSPPAPPRSARRHRVAKHSANLGPGQVGCWIAPALAWYRRRA
jgi:hypothetical protein